MEEAVKSGYQLLLSLTRWIPEEEGKALENLLNRQIDGLLCCIEPEEDSSAYRLLKSANIPIVFVNRQEPGFSSVSTGLKPALLEHETFCGTWVPESLRQFLPEIAVAAEFSGQQPGIRP